MPTSRFIIVSLLCVSAFTSLVLGAPRLTSRQKTALTKCTNSYSDAVNACWGEYPGSDQQSMTDRQLCEESAASVYKTCCNKAGIPLTQVPPPKGGAGIHHVPVNGVTAVGTVTPTPHKPKLSPDRTSSVAPMKTGTATPTPTPRPKATTAPLKKSNG